MILFSGDDEIFDNFLDVNLAYMAGMISTIYRVTPGGWLNGAQTLLLFAVALYCYGRSIRW